jgi:hypothetical protein
MTNEFRKMKNFLLEEKELSPKQKAIAKLDPPADEIDAGDFKALRAGKKPKMEVDTPNPPTDYGGKPAIPGLGPIVNEDGDHEVSMANNSIEVIIKAALELKSKLGNEEKDIPAWIQDHISKAENYITQASQNYHEYGDHEAEDIPVDGALEKMMETILNKK